MKRLVYSLFAVALVVSFNACEQHAAANLPPHYQHKADHGSHAAGDAHGAKDGKHAPEAAHAPALEKKH